MSEAAIFEFPYNLFLMERLEFVLICQDEWEAKILRLIEYDMAKQKEAWQNRVAEAIEQKKTPPKEPKEYWVRLSHAQIIARLYRFDSEKLRKPKKEPKHPLSLSKSSIRNTINSLIAKGFVMMRSKPGDEFGAPLYTLNRPLIQEKMRQLPKDTFRFFLSNGVDGGELETLELGVRNFGTGELETLEVPVPENETPQLETLEVFKESSNNENKNLEEENKRERDADASHARTFLQEHEELFEETTETLKDVKALQAQQQGEHHATLPTGSADRSAVGAGTRRTHSSVDRQATQAEMAAPPRAHTHETPPQALRPGNGARAEGLADASQTTRHQTDDPALDAHRLRGGVEAVAGAAPAQEALRVSSSLPPDDGAVGSAPPRGCGPRRSGKGKAQPQDVTQALSLQGAQVKVWMEEIKGRKRRMTPKNILAWNALGEEEDISFENLRDAIAKLESIKWVQEHDYVIDEHVLVQEDGKFTFAKGMELVGRKRKPKATAPSAEEFTSKTLDKERNDKRIAEMIEKSQKIRAEREAAQTTGK